MILPFDHLVRESGSHVWFPECNSREAIFLQFSVHVWNNKQWNNKQPSPCNHNFWQSSIPQGVVNRRNNWSRYSYCGSQYFHSITTNLRTLLQHQQHPLGPGRNTSYVDFMGDMMIVKLRGEIICQGISEHRRHPNIALTQPHYGFKKWLILDPANRFMTTGNMEYLIQGDWIQIMPISSDNLSLENGAFSTNGPFNIHILNYRSSCTNTYMYIYICTYIYTLYIYVCI